MPQRIYPNDRQIILAVLAGIASHPLIQNPPIYHPIAENGRRQQVKIDKFRAFSGQELIEPGLTLTVDFLQKPPTKPSLVFEPYTMGDTDPGEHLDQGLARVEVSLSIQDPVFDVVYDLSYEQVSDYSIWLAHGDQVSVRESNDYQLVSPDLQAPVITSRVAISFTPAEEILREYMSLLRAVIRDMRRFRPYTIRNPSIVSVQYKTAELFEGSPENLVFHKASMLVEFDFFEPPNARDLSLIPSIENFEISSTLENG